MPESTSPRGYAALIAPSSNRVYTKTAPRMAAGELELFGRALLGGRLSEIGEHTIGGVPYLGFRADGGTLDAEAVRALSNLSSLYALFELVGEGDDTLLRPVALERLDTLDDDLITIQKYVGKTNEQFTKLLLNATALAMDDPTAMLRRPLRVLDPMCGRGTTLNQVLMYGWDAAGMDVDGKDFDAYATFLRTWLKDKRMKHKAGVQPIRRNKERLGRRFEAEFGLSKEQYRAGEVRTVDVVHADTLRAAEFWRPAAFDLVVADAPYGVQHGSTVRGGGLARRPLELLAEAAPVWAALVRPGGAVGVSFNTHTASGDAVAELLAEAGLTPVAGPEAGFRHRVDQAIDRDLVVARRPRRG
ncbi:DNA modification methylase [Mangrovactinospora gilvigrisea]|uniref:DNA modification methylase n=1 Tax=Mangrovactinospora gilvigrisea TaxID=1428644 RepID=A0A1J7C2S8_9ACTN|nr:SAM-dependent methyltransferase [Mangrovactinospora gilvigrisea]OIV35872.1 DNA modification methylase [Mangrovactinospora gilvigrisea]